jgi:hypothetical protein
MGSARVNEAESFGRIPGVEQGTGVDKCAIFASHPEARSRSSSQIDWVKALWDTMGVSARQFFTMKKPHGQIRI